VLCDDLPLLVDHLPARLGALKPRANAGERILVPTAEPVVVASPSVAAGAAAAAKPVSLRELEIQAILEGLERNQGNKARTADELGISLKTLYNKLHQIHDGVAPDGGFARTA
jgi:DNA-binding NtrC family response regulator